jgi:hypothetical protein
MDDDFITKVLRIWFQIKETIHDEDQFLTLPRTYDPESEKKVARTAYLVTSGQTVPINGTGRQG